MKNPFGPYKPPWYKTAITKDRLKTAAVWLAIIGFVVFLWWDSKSVNERKLREVNAKAVRLIEGFETLSDEEMMSELEAIRSLTDEPEPEPEDPY